VPSIIVPARNNQAFTSTCLGSILFAVSRLNLSCEFILIDDASEAGENIIEVFKQHRASATAHHCKIVRSHKHQHYSGVFSIGLHLSTRDVIFFISNDMLVTPSFLEALLLVSSLSRDIGIVRGTSNYTDSHPEHQVEPPEPLKTYPEIDSFSRNQFSVNACSYVEDELLSGDAILLKRSLVERIGVLDMRFFGYFGDIDYGMRAKLAGFKLACAKGAWLYHEGAGHVKRQLERNRHLKYEDLHAMRMALVEGAYQEFRSKWHIRDGPPTCAGLRTTEFVAKGLANADRVSLKCDFPPSVIDDLEFY